MLRFISWSVFPLIAQKVPADNPSNIYICTDSPSVSISFNCESVLFFYLSLNSARTYFSGPPTLLSVNLPPRLFEICLRCCLVPGILALLVSAPFSIILLLFASILQFLLLFLSLQNKQKMIKVFANLMIHFTLRLSKVLSFNIHITVDRWISSKLIWLRSPRMMDLPRWLPVSGFEAELLLFEPPRNPTRLTRADRALGFRGGFHHTCCRGRPGS